MFRDQKRRIFPDVPAGSMADIAFLLLIFFLLTTTILNESGLLVRLPPWTEDPPTAVKRGDRNTLMVSINGNNELQVEEEDMALSDLQSFAMEFILNPTQDPTKAISPDKAVVSLIHDRGTEYATYLEVYNELLAAYRSARDLESRKRYGADYEDLPIARQKEIRAMIPMIISEAEPLDYSTGMED